MSFFSFFVKPRLHSKATSLRRTSAEPDDADDDTSMVSAADDGHGDADEHEETNDEGNSEEDGGEVSGKEKANETTAQESIGSTQMFYPVHIGLQAAIGYHLNFVMPSEVQTSLVGKHLPKWIFVKQHRYRLWYCERAEWFHPMFCPQAVEKRSVVDILNAEGISRSAVKNLYKKFKDLDSARPGGFTCNLCSKKVEPSEMILWDQYNQKEKKVSSEYNPSRVRSKATLEMAVSNCDPGVAPARDCLPVMKRVCQGYFCHHREMNGEALKLFNRCFSVCMECAMEQHLTYTPSSSDAIDEPDVELRGDLVRPRLRLRQSDYAQRLVRIEEDFKTKCFTAEALKRGAPAGTPWYVLADAALALVGTVPTLFAAPLERVGGSGEAVRVGALDTVGGLSIQALETPLELHADELSNELAIGQPQFVGTIGTFPAFARSQCYYFQEFVPNESDPARSRHPFSKGDGYLEVVQAREKKENKKAANTFSGALDVLIDALFKAESNARAKNVSQDGQYWRLVMEGVKSGTLSKKDRDELREAFLSSNGHVLQPSEGVITRGGGIEAELRPETAMEKDVLSKPQSSVELNFFAVSVASFFYSRTRAKEQWVVDASAIEADKEEKLKMVIENQAHAAELSNPDEEPSDKQVEQWQERVASGVSEIVEMTEPPNGPLACKEVPQFVRDVINIKYPLRIDEIEFKLIGVEEVDVLFYHAAQPLKFVSSALQDIASAMRGALSACYFGDSHEGEYEELLTTSGSPYRRRKYSGAAPSIEIALRNLRQALMVRATSCALEDKHKPSWCPPNFEPKSMDLGKKKIEYANLSFCRFHLESDDADAINPNEDLLDAISKFELWWSLNMQMYKVMGLQREYILFFSACVSTDQERFANTVATHFGVDKETGDASQSLKNATQALIQNIDAMKQMKEEVTAVIRHCNKGMSAVYKELRQWGMEWEKKEMRRAPTTVSSVVPFIIEITRSSEWDSTKRKRAASKIIERIEPFYLGSMEKVLKPPDLNRLLNRLVAWPAVARIAGIDEDEKLVLSAYYPHPLLKYLDFRDCQLEELNEKYFEVREQVLTVIENMALLDRQEFDLLARCRLNQTDAPPPTLPDAIKGVALAVQKFNKACKLHVFQTKGNQSADGYQLQAIVAPPTSSYFSLRRNRREKVQLITLPKQYHELTRLLQVMMGESAATAVEIDANFNRVKMILNGKGDEEGSISSYTHGNKNIGGDSKLTQILKATNVDKAVMSAALEAAKHNLRQLRGLMKAWSKLEKATNQWHQGTLRKTMKNEKGLFILHIDMTPAEYMRTKLAPKQCGQIIDFVACSILHEEKELVDDVINSLRSKSEAVYTADSELAGEDRRDFVRWCADQVESEVRGKSRASALSFGSSEGQLAPDTSDLANHARGMHTYDDNSDSAEEFYDDDDSGNAFHKAQKPGNSKESKGDTRGLVEEPEDVEEIDLGELNALKVNGNNMMIAVGLEEEMKKLERAGEEEFAAAQQTLSNPVQAYSEKSWGIFAPLFGEMVLDEFPDIKMSGMLRFDMVMQKVRAPFMLVCKSVQQWKSSRDSFLEACKALAKAEGRTAPSTLKHALLLLKDSLQAHLVQQGLGTSPTAWSGLVDVEAFDSSDEFDTLVHRDQPMSSEECAIVRAQWADKCEIILGGKRVTLSLSSRTALAALAMLLLSIEYHGGLAVKQVLCRTAQQQMKKAFDELKARLKSKVKGASKEAAKEAFGLSEEFEANFMKIETTTTEELQECFEHSRAKFAKLEGIPDLESCLNKFGGELAVVLKPSAVGKNIIGQLQVSVDQIQALKMELPKEKELQADINSLNLEALQYLEQKLPNANILHPLEKVKLTSPLQCAHMPVTSMLLPPNYMTHFMVDLSKTGEGAAKLMASMVGHILHPVMKALTLKTVGNILSSIAISAAKGILIDLVSMAAGPVMALGLIRKGFKAAKMTYKLVNNGVKMKRKLQSMWLQRKLQKKLVNKSKARVRAAMKELEELARATPRMKKILEKDHDDIVRFVKDVLPKLSQIEGKISGSLDHTTFNDFVPTASILIRVPFALGKEE